MKGWYFEEGCAEPENRRRYCQTRTVTMNYEVPREMIHPAGNPKNEGHRGSVVK